MELIKLKERYNTLERRLKGAEEEAKQKVEQKGREILSQKQVKELKHAWELSEIFFKSKKISFVFERDNIEKSIDIFKFQKNLFNEYGILLDIEEIKSFKTIGELKKHILNRVKKIVNGKAT